MSDKLIRELLINVKQKGATATAKSIQKVADGLIDAGAASELTNEQLAKMPKTLYSIERAADRAAKSLIKMQAFSPKGTSKGLSDMLTSMNRLEAGILEMTSATRQGFTDVVRASSGMTNSVGKQLETLNDRMYDNVKATRLTSEQWAGLGKNANTATRAIGNTSGAARGATRDFAAMAKVGGSLPILYAAIASNVFVLQTAFEQLKAGDQLNRLMNFGTIVGATSGVPVQNLAKALQEATGYAVSFEEAMKQASAAAAYGFTADQISQFALVARRAAAVLGVDMTDALNRVVKGVSKQEIELMDELGITIRLNEAYATYVKQLNAAGDGLKYTTDSLSSYQKQQAYANAVIAQSTKLFGNLDSVLRATPWEQFAANADTALKNVQMAAAKYLTPVANMINNIFYQSQIAGMLQEGQAAALTNAQIDPNNTRAMVASFQGAQDLLNKMEKSAQDFNVQIDTSKQRLYEIDKQITGTTRTKALANMFLGGDLEFEQDAKQVALLEEKKKLEEDISKAERERSNVMAARAQLQANYEERTNALLKAQPALAKEVAQTGKTIVDPAKVKVLGDLTESMANFAKNIAPDIKTSMADLTNTTSLGTVVGQLSDVKREVEQQANITGESADVLIQKYGLGITSMKQFNEQLSATKTLQDQVGNETQNELALAQKRNDLLKAGVDSKKVDIQISNMEVGMLDRQIAAYERINQTVGHSAQVDAKINELRVKRLGLLNGQYGKEEKVKDVRDKVVGIEREIALLNNRTMTDSQYNVARLKMELDVENDRLKILQGRADKEKEYEQSRRNIAQIEREIWKEQLDRNAKTAEMRKEAFENSMTTLYPLAGENQRLELQLQFYKDMKEFTKGNAEEQARWNGEIAKTTAQIKALAAQRTAQMMAGVASSVGADYTPTTGLSGADQKNADMQNKMASYDTAISKLGELNSEAMAVGQSMGNLTNAMLQFSQGSLDTTTTIAAGMQMVSSMISMGVSQQVSAIDQAIAAEQKRDGKSEASKAKLKKLEAEKIKIQQDAAKKQIIIQTAVAVMQAATAVPYPWSIPLMVAAGLAGAMALAQASSASGMSSIADSGSDTASYLTLGERQKNVDVSLQANAGEAAYMRGDQGIGGANSFVPRAEGGNMYPGVSYQMGEHGTEVLTPMVPMKATPNDEVGKGNGGANATVVQLSVQAMDAQSFMQFALQNPEAFRSAVESALNERGKSLNSLGQ